VLCFDFGSYDCIQLMLLFGEPLKQNPDEDKATFVLSCTFDLRLLVLLGQHDKR